MPLIYDWVNVGPQTWGAINMITGLLEIWKDLSSPIVLIGQLEKAVSHEGLVHMRSREFVKGSSGERFMFLLVKPQWLNLFYWVRPQQLTPSAVFPRDISVTQSNTGLAFCFLSHCSGSSCCGKISLGHTVELAFELLFPARKVLMLVRVKGRYHKPF